MFDDEASTRARADRVAARGRARRHSHTDAQDAFEHTGESARRLIQGEELLTNAELVRARLQLEIAREDRQDEAWHKAELAQYKAEAWTWNARARITLATRVLVGVAAIVLVACGVASGVSPPDAWHFLTSIR